ncbi:MAG: general stress protein [Exiguobacterium sp.]|uniref:general stress protein n=1 Tax=Exiguobacterium alkaliphilum TaxID=1428684 RepID=UPI0029C3D295|nr:general stress protein [Exiguobacterium sp.]MDX5425588.1 general stress protein [Exiguobacterium sp.]MDX6772989.1 general stress protein [Exiguobacterium sp.]
MSEKQFVSMYETQQSALGKIEELRAKGYKDSDIYVVAKHEDNVSILRRQTDVHTEASHETGWFDKVRAFLSGKEDVHSGLRNMGLSEEEVNRHYRDVEDGKILIYVDEDFERRHNDGLTIDSTRFNESTHGTSHQGHHTADGLEIDSTRFNETTGDNPNRAVDPEQDRLDEKDKLNDKEAKLRGLDDRALRNDFEDPDNVRRF